MLNEDIFLDSENWYGGFYELALEFPSEAKREILKALEILWKEPDLHGAYKSLAVPMSQQTKVPIQSLDLIPEFHYYGIYAAKVGSVPCGSFVFTPELGPRWLVFYLPMAALAKVYPLGGFPFDTNNLQAKWRIELNKSLVKIAENILRFSLFLLCLVGPEVMGETSISELKQNPPHKDTLALLSYKGALVDYRALRP